MKPGYTFELLQQAETLVNGKLQGIGT